MSVQTAYLGWEALEHRQGCSRPVWTVDVRTEDQFRPRHGGPEHACPNEECDHRGGRFEATTVRIVCSSCGAAHLFGGSEHVRRTSTQALGYGQPPRRAAGLWLWPDAPLIGWGPNADEPWGFLVTRERVDRVTAADVVGEIQQGRGKRGGVVWSAAAVPAPDGRYGVGPVRWSRATEDLRSVAAAAKWIAAQAGDAS